MARHGVWELERLIVRYCATSGSSRGVRDFVETSLIPFAEKNPHLEIKTTICSGHPHIYGRYITGYARRWCVKNLDADQVARRVKEMRDTLGRKTPRHSHISNAVVEKKNVSVQGVWRNERQSDRLTPLRQMQREHLERDYGMKQLVNQVGLAGIVHMTKQLVASRAVKRMSALNVMPKRYVVPPTE